MFHIFKEKIKDLNASCRNPRVALKFTYNILYELSMIRSVKSLQNEVDCTTLDRLRFHYDNENASEICVY